MTEPSRPSDGELLAEFLTGKGQTAFAELVNRHGKMVHGVALRVLADHHEAQDVAQAAFLILTRKASGLCKAESVGGWLHKVAWRVALDVQRSRRSRQQREEVAMHEQPAAVAANPDTGLFRAELDAALNQLPERYRQPLVLFHLEGGSLDEVGRMLGLNPNTLRTRLARARELLRKKLVRRGVSVGSASALTTLLSAEAGAAVLPATFVSATVQAASLAATGKLAAGVGTGAVSANVASLTKGAIQMMFIAQLKTAALITAACVVVAGGGAVVAKEMLTPPATPVSAQAEPKGLPPPTPATNDTATIAWGAITNELQAGLVPLGRGAEGGDWGKGDVSIFFCPKCAGKPHNATATTSTAAKSRVCAACGTDKPWSATFVEGEPLVFEVHLRNAGDKNVLVGGVHHWFTFVFTPAGGGVPRQATFTPQVPMAPPGSRDLPGNGYLALVEGVGGGSFYETWKFEDARPNQDKSRPAIPALPPGKYSVTARYGEAHPEHAPDAPCRFWHGKIATGTVEIEIKAVNSESNSLEDSGRNAPAAGAAGKIDPHKPHKYVSGKWEYDYGELKIWSGGGRNPSCWGGQLTYDGSKPTLPPFPKSLDYSVRTPWGWLVYRHCGGKSGHAPAWEVLDGEPAADRVLPDPAAVTAAPEGETEAKTQIEHQQQIDRERELKERAIRERGP